MANTSCYFFVPKASPAMPKPAFQGTLWEVGDPDSKDGYRIRSSLQDRDRQKLRRSGGNEGMNRRFESGWPRGSSGGLESLAWSGGEDRAHCGCGS